MKVILYAPVFYGYGDSIEKELICQGHKVFRISHNISRLIDFFLTFFPAQYNIKIREAHLRKQLQRIPIEECDVFLVVRGQHLSLTHTAYLKERNNSLRFVMYQWDSVRNFDYTRFIPIFDKIFTFDFKDADDLNISYLPLFYLNDIIPVEVEENIDLLFVASNTPQRTQYLGRLKELSNKYGLRICYYLVNSFSSYVKDFLTHNLYYSRSDIHFQAISRSQLIKLYQKSKVFVDITSPLQTGLSMRIIECYAMNKKLLSSNDNIGRDDNVREILSVSADATDSDILELIKTPSFKYKNVGNLSLSNWLKTIIC